MCLQTIAKLITSTTHSSSRVCRREQIYCFPPDSFLVLRQFSRPGRKTRRPNRLKKAASSLRPGSTRNKSHSYGKKPLPFLFGRTLRRFLDPLGSAVYSLSFLHLAARSNGQALSGCRRPVSPRILRVTDSAIEEMCAYATHPSLLLPPATNVLSEWGEIHVVTLLRHLDSGGKAVTGKRDRLPGVFGSFVNFRLSTAPVRHWRLSSLTPVCLLSSVPKRWKIYEE